LISRERRFIFVHIPKTGGSSLKSVLGGDWQNHKDLKRYRKELEPSEFDSFFKFAIIRNPWERLVSEYAFQTRLSGSRSSKLHARDQQNRARDFDSWVRAVFEEPFAYPAAKWGGSVSKGLHRWSPQVDWVRLDGEIGVDFIARLESIDTDSAEILRRIGLPPETLPRKKQTLRRHYSSFYTDETREFVAEQYAEDISTFGYSFEEQPHLGVRELANRVWSKLTRR